MKKPEDMFREIMEMQDAAYIATLDSREAGADDAFFSRVSQWDDAFTDLTGLRYRGQFDLLRKEKRRLLAEQRANPIEVQFQPLDGADPDDADLLQGLYRRDMRDNASRQAINTASEDQIDIGYGAWRITTEYESSQIDSNRNLVIRRKPIHEANNTVFWDPNSILIDKSDAAYCSIITAYNDEGYEALCEELGLEDETPDSPYEMPVESGVVFPWYAEKKIYVGEYYTISEKKETVYIYEDSNTGEMKVFSGDQLSKKLEDGTKVNIEDDLAAMGLVQVGSKRVKRRRIDKYYVSGAKILKGPVRVPGENIPIVPVFGEWHRVDGREVWEGITRLAKDPQRLANTMKSYAAEIAMQSPRSKPVWAAEQIAGFEAMHESTSEFPYLLQNLKSSGNGGRDLPLGPLGVLQPPDIPAAIAQMIPVADQAVADVTSPGMPQDVLDPQASGKAILAMQTRIDMQSFIYQDNLAFALRRDGEIYASIAAEIYDTPRKVKTITQDGSEKDVLMLQVVIDRQTGVPVVLNDLRNKRFEVYTDVGPSYQSQKQQYRSEIIQLYQSVPPQSPVSQILLLQYLMLQDGPQHDLLRDYANKQLLAMGIKQPQTEEDEQYVQQLQAQQQAQAQQADPQAEALLAMARESEAKAIQAMASAENQHATAEKNMAEAAKTMSEIQGTKIDNMAQALQLIQEQLAQMVPSPQPLAQQDMQLSAGLPQQVDLGGQPITNNQQLLAAMTQNQ